MARPMGLMATLVIAGAAFAAVGDAAAMDVPEKPDGALRFATFNVALHGDVAPGEVIVRLANGWPRARLAAEVIQHVRPDVLVLQELDRDDRGEALALFADGYLGVAQGEAEALPMRYRVLLPTNTGVPSGADLDGSGDLGESEVAYARDARGFGFYPGQYGFSILSQLPVTELRTFTDLLWRDMPDSRLPADLPDAARAALPLSSKTHALVTFAAPGGAVHVVAAHPTPPIQTALNVARNADEIRLAADLLDKALSGYAVDDEGRAGGLPADAPALVMGDLNADPNKGDSADGAIDVLLQNPRIEPVEPTSPRGANTARFNNGMRVDYVLPTVELEILGSGVFWPDDDHPLARLNAASDHHLVWVDVRLP